MLIDELIKFFMLDKTQEELALTAITVTHDGEVAQDILHDVYCLLYLKADKIGYVAEPMAFLRKCVRNVAKNWVAREARKISVDPSMIDSLPAYHSIDQNIKLFEMRDWVKTNLPEYEEERVEAFLQFYLDGYSLEVLSKVYGVSANTLSKQFSRMRAKLKKKHPTYFFLLMVMIKIH